MSVIASTIGGVVLAATFTLYPGKKATDARVEAITDRGPIKKLIVRCPVGTAIITYSPVERLYCTPQLRCMADMETVIARTCR
ncbi:MAG: hypothetical protein AB1749_11290 [Pseudomonadota bacterium]